MSLSHPVSPPPPPITENPGEDKDTFAFTPITPHIETAPHPPRDTMTTYPMDILPPLKDTFPRSSSHTGTSTAPQAASSGSASAGTTSGNSSPQVKNKALTHPSWETTHIHNTGPLVSVDGKHSPRRRNSLGGGLTPLSQARVLLSPDAGSPSRSPQMSHGSLLHHEHSTPALIDLPPAALGAAALATASTGTPRPTYSTHDAHSPSLGPTTTSSTLLPTLSLNSIAPQTSTAFTPTTPFTPSSLAATLPSLSARRNSKPLLWSGNNHLFKQFLSSHTVADLVASLPHRQIVVEIESTLSPYEGFEILLKNNILAAPVWDPIKKEYTGFLDVRDLVSSVIFAHEEQVVAASQPWSETWMDVAKKGLTKYEKLGSASITYLSRRSAFRPVRLSDSLLDVAKALSTQLHRVPVIDEQTRRCINIMSQSTIITFLIQHKQDMKDEWKQSIASLSLGLCKVISISQDSTAWMAFKLIEVSGVSGIAVVDHEGKLVGNTSAKDLKLFMLDRGNLSLDQPIMEYLSQIRQRENVVNEAHPSCSVSLSHGIGHVIELMSATKYHRVFLVDNNSRPIGVLSVTDILRYACADQANTRDLQLGLQRLSDSEHRGSLSAGSSAHSISGVNSAVTSPLYGSSSTSHTPTTPQATPTSNLPTP